MSDSADAYLLHNDRMVKVQLGSVPAQREEGEVSTTDIRVCLYGTIDIWNTSTPVSSLR